MHAVEQMSQQALAASLLFADAQTDVYRAALEFEEAYCSYCVPIQDRALEALRGRQAVVADIRGAIVQCAEILALMHEEGYGEGLTPGELAETSRRVLSLTRSMRRLASTIARSPRDTPEPGDPMHALLEDDSVGRLEELAEDMDFVAECMMDAGDPGLRERVDRLTGMLHPA